MLQRQNTKMSGWVWVILGVIFVVILSVFRIQVLSGLLGNNEVLLSKTERDELESLRVENETLKNNLSDLKEEINLMEDGLEPTYVKMLGRTVLGEMASNYYGSFYVTYPKDKTVYKGMNVYSHGNVLVGTVEEVLKTSLFVNRIGQNKTFFAESSEVDEELELSALGNGLYVGSIAAGSKISVGDQVVLKGYPKAVVGMVNEVVKNEGTLSTVFVRAPYNIYNKEIFYVLQ
jgi:cell division protein FtsB